MARLRALAAAASVASMAFTVGWALPASAGTSTGAPGYSEPTWWQKFETVSAPGFQPLPGPGQAGSVSVGANVDVSNEPGPQSETSIAINPADPKQIVAGSNEIDRLPMRGYFSSDGGSTWGAVDLPLPPALNGSGTDFGSDPAVAWDTQGNVFYAYIVVFFNHGFNAITGTEMAVARSSDAGRTPGRDLLQLQLRDRQVQRQALHRRGHEPGEPVPGHGLRCLGQRQLGQRQVRCQ